MSGRCLPLLHVRPTWCKLSYVNLLVNVDHILALWVDLDKHLAFAHDLKGHPSRSTDLARIPTEPPDCDCFTLVL